MRSRGRDPPLQKLRQCVYQELRHAGRRLSTDHFSATFAKKKVWLKMRSNRERNIPRYKLR